MLSNMNTYFVTIIYSLNYTRIIVIDSKKVKTIKSTQKSYWQMQHDFFSKTTQPLPDSYKTQMSTIRRALVVGDESHSWYEPVDY